MPKLLADRSRENLLGLLRSTGGRELVVVGLPWDATSSFRRGATAGPDAVREATSGRLYNRFTEQGIDLTAHWKVCDHGNIKEVSDTSKVKEALARQMFDTLQGIEGLHIVAADIVEYSPRFDLERTTAFDQEVVERLWTKYGIALRAEDYYSRVPKVYDVSTMIRVSLVHYNTPEEIAVLLKGLAEIGKS